MSASLAPDPLDFDPFAGPAVAHAVPSTEPQREVWAATRMGADASLAFNESVTLRLHGALDAAALEGALVDLVARHESLRAAFAADGLTMVVFEAGPSARCERHDWSELPVAAAEARLRALEDQAVREPFDLVAGPLVRFALARLTPDDHALVVTAHHIVCDGWSFGVVARELPALYNARLGTQPAALPPADRFTDYAVAQRANAAREEREAAERYWLGQFAGAPPVLDLPTDAPRPPSRTYAAGRVDRVLDATLVHRVSAAAKKSGASLFVALCAGFGTLLRRLTGAAEVVVGVPAAGQAAAGTPHLVGHAVSMLPVRLRVDGDGSYAALLAEVRTRVLDGQEHQALTFGDLLTRLPGARDASRPPLVAAVFNFERASDSDAPPFAGLHASLRANARAYETFELFLNAVERDGAVTLECQYNSALYTAETVARWLASLERLLAAAADAPGTAVDDLPVRTAADDAVEARGRAAQLVLPPDALVHRMIEAQAARTPDATAVEAASDRAGDAPAAAALTYAALDARANQIARRLRALGVRRGGRVGLCVPRTPELLASLLGVLKAGAAYVPLDPDYPADRLAFMLADAGAAAVVTTESARDALPLGAGAPPVLSLDGDGADVAAESAAAVPVDDEAAARPGDAAYVIYTSGSTGTPKGVVVPHRAAVNLLMSAARTPGVTAADRVLAVTTLSFDIALAELVLPLTVGARVVLATREDATDGARLRRIAETRAVTFVDATPATYRLLLGAGWEGGPHVRAVCTGEAMPRDLAELLVARVRELWNGYGPTETTVWSTFWRAEAPVTRVRIGTPVANTRLYVLDGRGRPVPAGAAGELYIGGAGVATGYHNRAALTAERFLPDPFADGPGARMYRTGDVVRVLADGSLECLGRNDHQVKVRGYRIELGEIEARLAAHPAVAECAVAAREDRPGDVRLVGYIVDRGAGAGDGELRAHLKRRLPDFMAPSTYVRLSALPLTPNGKVDRRALPAPEAAAAPADAFVAPRTETERAVAELWAAALGVAQVGVRDDFFALGGHSLLASRVLARLRAEHGVELPFRRVFEAPTVEEFARLVDAARGDAAAAPVGPPLARRADQPTAPLTATQERQWLLEELSPATRSAHTHVVSWRLRGALDEFALVAAVEDFAARHPILATRFAVVEGEHVQETAERVRVQVPRLDLSRVPEAERDARVRALVHAEQDRPSGPHAEPLFRVFVVRLTADEHMLFTTRHGMTWDGWSSDLFASELAELYSARVERRAPRLAELPVTYGDFAAWQRDRLASSELVEHAAWWRAHLSGELPVLDLPTDRPRPATPTLAGDRVTLDVELDEVARLRDFARGREATLFMVLFAAYSALLARWSGQRDVVVGVPVRARPRPELEHVVGPFVNTVALRNRPTPELPFAALLAEVRETTLAAFSRQEVPFEAIGGRPPVLRAIFSMQDVTGRPTRMAGVALEPYELPERHATVDLTFVARETAAGLGLALNYSTELFDARTAARFLDQFRRLLTEAVRDPGAPIGAMSVAHPAEQALLVGCAMPAPAEAVASRVARRAAAGPDAPAIVAEGVIVTRSELADRVARAAVALRDLGPTPGAPVLVATRSALGRAVGSLAALAIGAEPRGSDPDAPAPHSAGRLTAAVATVTDDLGVEGVMAEVARHAARLSVTGDGHVIGAPAAPAMGAFAPAGNHPTVAVDHAVADLAATLGVSDGDRVVCALPASHSLALLEVLLPLAAGATLIAPESDLSCDPARVAAALQRAGATIAFAYAADWIALAGAGWTPPSGFRAVIVDGPVAADDRAGLSSLLVAGARVVVLSAAVGDGWPTALYELTAADCASNDAGTRTVLGRPFGDARVAVRDSLGAPALLGIYGALHVGRAGGALATAGVRARRTADGMFEYDPRDPSIAASRRGTLTSLDRVERALATHPAVSAAAVRSVPGLDGEPQLVAHVVVRPGVQHTATELRAAVRAELPRHLAPHLIVPVSTLPTDAPDAVDRGAGTGVHPAHAASPDAGDARTDAERRLAALWSELLGGVPVRRDSNFFMLGGYSLLCFRVIERVHAATGVRLSPRTFLTGTLAQAAASLEGARWADVSDAPDASAAEANPADSDDGAQRAPSAAPGSAAPAHRVRAVDPLRQSMVPTRWRAIRARLGLGGGVR